MSKSLLLGHPCFTSSMVVTLKSIGKVTKLLDLKLLNILMQPLIHFRFLPHINMYRVIHSMHASYSELRDFVTYLKPKRIIPCVVPFGDSSLAGVCSRLFSHYIIFLTFILRQYLIVHNIVLLHSCVFFLVKVERPLAAFGGHQHHS